MRTQKLEKETVKTEKGRKEVGQREMRLKERERERRMRGEEGWDKEKSESLKEKMIPSEKIRRTKERLEGVEEKRPMSEGDGSMGKAKR